jgi:DNA-binding beta-propeller fold protein YncE
LVAISLLVLQTASAAAAPGDLSLQACFADTTAGGCQVPTKAALARAHSVAVSPDGRSVYVVSNNDDSISSFVRSGDGTLTFQGCFADTATSGCAVPEAASLNGAWDVAVSPDGLSVYVSAGLDRSITEFRRAADGSLTFESCYAATNVDGCAIPFANEAFQDAAGIAVSPDGTSVYLVSTSSDGITQFDRSADGEITFHACIRDSPAAGCSVPATAALFGASDVVVSPDGSSVYVTANTDDAISRFARDASGVLTFKSCLADTNASGCEVLPHPLLDASEAVAISPDGQQVYVTSENANAVSIFTRAAAGALTFGSCFADTAQDGCAVPTPAVLDHALGVTASPDGTSLYVTSNDNAVSVFRRGADGNFAFQSCVADDAASGCVVPSPVVALKDPQSIAVSPDGTSAYVASVLSDSLSIFTREQPVIVPPATPDITAPETVKGEGPKKKVKTHKRRAKLTFSFSSAEASAVFRCSLDDAAASACTSPATAKIKAKRKPKKHSFSVAAVDAAGNVDQTPIAFKFKVKRKG